MEKVVTSAEMQACDRFAIDKLKIPGLILMENAGRGVVEMMERHFGLLAGKSIMVFCGKGNNGGDGFVIARHLYNRGANVCTVLVGKSSKLKGDAGVNYKSVKNIAKSLQDDDSLRLVELTSRRGLSVLPRFDIIVDALFGTGFSGELRGIYKEVIDWINQAAGKKVSVDIPSGLNADNGEVGSVAVRADLTVTMELRKIGLIVYQGMTCTGELEVVDIGIPREVVSNNRADTYVVREEDVRRILPSRTPRAHKHSVGKIFILAGSRGLTGAAAMASSSAMRAGAGAVVLGTPVSVYPILAKKVTEVMVEPLPETPDGTLAASSYDIIQKHLQWADILILGPGISRNSETSELVWQLVSQCDKPMLIDADGLNILSQKLSILKKHGRKEIIITPHTGELSRLIGMPSEEIERDRVEIARKVARQFTLTLVLKGAPTVTASEDGKVYINSTGNPGMATAGSGDVLAGLIGGLWAQGMKRTEAAYAGVFLHGLAGDRARQVFGEKSLMATDIQEQLPKVLLDLEGGQCG